MKKKLIKVLFCTGFLTSVFAQTEINSQWKNQINPIFQGLDKTKVPNGILLDYAMEFTNVLAYNGTLTDSTSVNANALGNIYKTLFMGKVTTSTQYFPKIEEVAKNWSTHRQSYNQINKSTIVLAGLYYQYASINPNALASNKITVSNNKYYDKFIGTVWQNPYQTNKTIAFASAVGSYNKLNFGVVMPQNMWLTNSASNVQTIQINFNDGSGYKILNIGQKVYANYTVNGTYNWVFKTTLTNGTVLYSQSKMVIDAPLSTATTATPSMALASADFANNIVIPGPVSSFPYWANGAILRIDYAPSSNGQLKKPFIVAEGFDPGAVTEPEKEGGESTLKNFNFALANKGNITSILEDNSTQQYDIVYIDWQNGTNSIQHNSEVFKNVLAWVNANKVGTQPNVVLGQSMGGVIGRYALKKMEIAGIQHQVRLFIAHDAPLQGANTPLSIQYFTRHAYNMYTNAPVLYGSIEIVIPTILNMVELMSLGNLQIAFPSVSDLLTVQDTPAATQMNYHYVDKNSNTTMAVHNAWQQEFDSLGYPTQCRNIAISNGNECAVNHGFTAGANLISIHDTHNPGFWGDLVHIFATPIAGFVTNDPTLVFLGLLTGSSKYFFDFDIKTNPSTTNTNREVYWGKVRYEKKLLWLIKISHTITDRHKYASNDYLPFDTYSGGQYDLMNILITTDPDDTNPIDRIPSGSVVNPRYGFIPVVSALDIKRNNGAVITDDYLKKYAGGNMPEPSLSTTFSNYIVDFNNGNPINNAHISFQVRNGNWLAEELNVNPENPIYPIADCSFICSNTQITGADLLCTSSTYTAPSGGIFNNWTITQGASLVTLTGNGTPNVTLTALPNTSGAITLSLTMGDDGAKCGNVTLTKTIWVGKPSFTFEYTYFEPQPVKSTLCAISDVSNLTLAQQGVTNVIYTTSNNEFISNWGGPYCVRGTNVFCVNATATNACGSTTLQYDCDFGRIANNNMFKIYPNPSNDIVNIEIRDENNIPEKSATVSGELFDMMGQSKSKVEIYNNKSTFSVKGLNKGIYVLKIYIDSQIESHQIAVE